MGLWFVVRDLATLKPLLEFTDEDAAIAAADRLAAANRFSHYVVDPLMRIVYSTEGQT